METSGFDFEGFLAGLRAAHEARAAERGFASAEAMHEADAEAENATKARQYAAVESEHRHAVALALAGRLRPEVAEALWRGRGLRRTAAIRSVADWLESTKPTIILAGGTGAGKTVAAAWGIGQRVGGFQVARAARIGAMYERWQSDREDGVEPLRLGVSTLLLDDLGREALEDRRAMVALEEIFDARQTPNLRTICTTNLTREQLRERYSERILSRLSATAAFVSLDDADMRRAQ